MPRKPKAKAPRLLLTRRETVAVPLPRPKGRDGMSTGKLPVPHLMVVLGVRFASYMPKWPTARMVAGWRLYVAVDGAVLVDGAPLSTVLRLPTDLEWHPFRDAGTDICILTPREDPVDVHVAVEWHGKGKRTRLPKGMEVRIHGVY